MYSPEISNYLAGGTIAAFTIVKKGSDDNTVVAASAATDKVMGVTAGPTTNTSATGDRVDVITGGYAEVLAGGSFVAGDLLMADSNGKAIVATASAGSNVRIIGMAMKDGASGDIVKITVSPSIYQG